MIAWQALTVEKPDGEEMRLELWINMQDKLVSFWSVPGWDHQIYGSEKSLREQLDRFVAMGFRFQ